MTQDFTLNNKDTSNSLMLVVQSSPSTEDVMKQDGTTNDSALNETLKKEFQTEQPLYYLMDKVTDVALKYEGAALILVSALATALIISVVTKGAAELIKVLRGH